MSRHRKVSQGLGAQGGGSTSVPGQAFRTLTTLEQLWSHADRLVFPFPSSLVSCPLSLLFLSACGNGTQGLMHTKPTVHGQLYPQFSRLLHTDSGHCWGGGAEAAVVKTPNSVPGSASGPHSAHGRPGADMTSSQADEERHFTWMVDRF